jgi:hypothetical protein
MKKTPFNFSAQARIVALVSCLGCLACAAPFASAESVPDAVAVLPPGHWSEPSSGVSIQSFTLGAGEKHHVVWGSYSPDERHFFDEFLPALFERTLVVDSLDASRGFKWIFTGERASLTIAYTGAGKELRAWIDYYDSFAFPLLSGKLSSHPNLTQHAVAFKIPATQSLRAIAVRLDHKQTLTVSADGSPFFELQWFHSFSRHRLQLTGNTGKGTFRLLGPQARAATVTVDPSQSHQTMLGWGGTGTPTAYRELSMEGRRRWWKYIAEYDLLIQREFPAGAELREAMDNWDNLADAKAQYYGDNCIPNGEVSDFAYNRAIQELGGLVIFEFWDFPPWIGDSPVRYASAMLNYCQTAKTKTGRAPFAVGIQNEYPMKPELVEPFVAALRQTLDDNDFKDVRIHMANAPSILDALERLPVYRDNPAVWNKIDFSAANAYDMQLHFSDPDALDSTLTHLLQ